MVGCTSGLQGAYLGRAQNRIGLVGTWDTPVSKGEIIRSKLTGCVMYLIKKSSILWPHLISGKKKKGFTCLINHPQCSQYCMPFMLLSKLYCYYLYCKNLQFLPCLVGKQQKFVVQGCQCKSKIVLSYLMPLHL